MEKITANFILQLDKSKVINAMQNEGYDFDEYDDLDEAIDEFLYDSDYNDLECLSYDADVEFDY